MDHNPHKFWLGQQVLLDDSHVVRLKEFTPMQIFSVVVDETVQPNSEWTVMTSRLTPIDKLKI
jgi:hypothetical protein